MIKTLVTAALAAGLVLGAGGAAQADNDGVMQLNSPCCRTAQ